MAHRRHPEEWHTASGTLVAQMLKISLDCNQSFQCWKVLSLLNQPTTSVLVRNPFQCWKVQTVESTNHISSRTTITIDYNSIFQHNHAQPNVSLLYPYTSTSYSKAIASPTVLRCHHTGEHHSGKASVFPHGPREADPSMAVLHMDQTAWENNGKQWESIHKHTMFIRASYGGLLNQELICCKFNFLSGLNGNLI